MDSPADPHHVDGDVVGDGVTVQLETGLHIAALRYFEPAGPFVRSLAVPLGGSLPAPLQALLRRRPGGPALDGAGPGPEMILAWRSPSETLLIAGDAALGAAVGSQVAGRADGCVVDQTGGITALRVTGARAADLLLRLGPTETLTSLGAARTGRLAEVAVMCLCVRPAEFWLLVERVHRRHLLGWIRATVADF